MTPIGSVWHVAREYAGVAEAGGVKDMVRGLAEAQARSGMTVTAVVPLYGFARDRLVLEPAPLASFTVRLPDLETWSRMEDEPVTIREARAEAGREARTGAERGTRAEAVRLLLLDSPRFANKRDVYTWTAEDERENPHRRKGSGHWDVHHLNLLLQRGALEAAVLLGEIPSVFHCHDGHAAFLPAIAREDARLAPRLAESRMVVTIHNAGEGYHQEIWDPKVAGLLTGLDAGVIAKGVLRGKADPFLIAAPYARINTVSEEYAAELLAERDAEMAGGLGRAYRERGVPFTGITNGVDGEAWDPRHPERTGLPSAFDPGSGDLAGKHHCREALVARLGPRAAAGEPGQPLFAFVGRLTGQKGVDVLQAAIRVLAQSGDCPLFVMLGTGDRAAEGTMHALARDLRDRFVFAASWDPSLADLIYAAADFLVLPSVYEPCGLVDFHGQVVGAVPLVHAIGGLRKVRDGETGYSYENQDPSTLAAAIRRCARIHREDPAALAAVRRRAFREIFDLHTWDRVHREGYLPLYRAAGA
ncbi:MAG: glycogen/starch synthase [Spirochaetes bacterium]|nr:glycogen/starch synthase [Spirochaetota bacterium]